MTMNTVCRDIFRAIYEEKWLSIEYKNEHGEITKYWIGIIKIDPDRRTMKVLGLHLSLVETTDLKIFIDSILSSAVIDGSYFKTDDGLKKEIEGDPEKYQTIFQNVANLKILNYLADCNKLDTTPYRTDYTLIRKLDGDSIRHGNYRLDDDQLKEIVMNFQYGAKRESQNKKIRQIALNVLSINTRDGLYVLAYRGLKLDVKERVLRPDEDVTICTEFVVGGRVQSIRKFLDAEDYELLENFEKNAELIKDRITQGNHQINGVDDMPYLVAVGRDMILDLAEEYAAVSRMFEEDKVTVPIKAFFGDLLKLPGRRKDYPIALLNKQINLDQLLAIHNAVKYPLTYVQGPPGTGKTNTIVNTIITAFFNEKTVLFASYNNHPIDGVCEKLQQISYRNKGNIPFPVIRLGNDDKVLEALDYIKSLYEQTETITVYDNTLKKNKDDKISRTKELTGLLRRYEDRLDLMEREEAIQKLMDSNHHLTFQTELQGVQLEQVRQELRRIGEITDEEALKLVLEDEEEFKKYLFYTSAGYIQRLKEPKNQDLLDIVYHKDKKEKVKLFNQYLKKEENLKKFQRIFPVIATTSISAHKIGEPGTYFDMVIMDEASQGNIAVSLVPVIRGRSLMLVGDPQQLSPVILLDAIDNEKLRRMYGITEEYDYIKNSIYKTYLACDSVSPEILLSHHYRCHRRIIEFNNKKYYNNKLVIESRSQEEHPLVFREIPDNIAGERNTSPAEAEAVLEFVQQNRDRSIGIITPFSNQKDMINEMLRQNQITDVPCGTVHAFQGDEKDVILFSLAVTENTGQRTYEWMKNHKELINVATSRAREQLVILSSEQVLDKLHGDEKDDLYELVQYVKNNGLYKVTPRVNPSRALGVKPYSTETEAAFLINLNHALENVLNTDRKCLIRREVAISHVFNENVTHSRLFYTGRFDFVVYELDYRKKEIPILAIELDGREHAEDNLVKQRDLEKDKICSQHGFELIRIENSYARRYHYMKEILIRYFERNGRR